MKRHKGKIEAGIAHLGSVDPIMRGLIGKCPPLTTLNLHSNRFEALAHSILSQQISVHAARTIRSRLTDLVGRGGLRADAATSISSDQLRAIGISGVKVSYLKDLARTVHSGKLRLNTIGRFNDAQVIEQLVQVKGIGVWTAQMFLIFSLGRLDVFPHQDHGVRAAITRLYGLEELPDKATSFRIAEPWRPYATIASWYCWRSHELEDRTSDGICGAAKTQSSRRIDLFEP